MKNKIPEYFHLEFEEILPDDSYLLDSENYSVKCVFQIWKKKDFIRQKIKSQVEINFKYSKLKSESDVAIRRVGVYAGKAFTDVENKSDQSHYFIILDDKSKINLLIQKLDSYQWTDLTVGPRSISKSELNDVLNEIL